MPERAPTPHTGNVHAWIQDTFARRGFFGAVRFYAAGLFELVRDLTPARRRSRYGDIDFDFEHGVDTTWATVSLRTRIREWFSGGQYQPSDPELFRRILAALPIAVEGFTFIDLGSGKGRSLLMAASFPFRRIVGIELLDELNAAALQNIARYRSDDQLCFAIESHSGDARRFDFPPEPIVLYLFNPFPEHVLREVLENLRSSWRVAPRAVYVIYHHLIHQAVLAEQTWLQPIHRTHQYAVYKAVAEG